MRILITGGAGFVGANLAVGLAGRHRDWDVVAYDSLHRPGSELNVPRLEQAGVDFVQADVRDLDRLLGFEGLDALIECCAEPSAQAGADGDTAFAVHTNLVGAYNCLELARRENAQIIFLSSSRVYPVASLNALRMTQGASRFELSSDQEIEGASAAGISERFPMEGARTLYGATKLAAELLIEEYAAGFGLPTVVNRCGVIAGPWQMGKVDQGVFAFWVFHHHFGLPLSYIGYGGSGLQVRDLMQVSDLLELIDDQLTHQGRWAGFVGNVGGGAQTSLSLLEATEICRELTGNEVPIEAVPEARPGDVPVYLSDCGLLAKWSDWRPRRDAGQIFGDIHRWTVDHEAQIAAALGLNGGAG